MLRKANNLFTVLLDDNSKTAAALNASCPVGTVVTDANLAKGAIVLCNVGLERLDNAAFAALADGDQFIIVQGKGTGKPLMKSPVLTKGKVKMTISKHKAAQQQITVIGYNGTTGSLPTANDTSFFIKIRKNDNDAGNRSQPMSLFAQYKTDGTGTQEELAFGLAANGNKNFADEPANGYIKFEVLCDEAGTAISNDAGDTIVGTKGSKVVTLTDSGDNDLAGMVVGNLFRVGTATTDEVYKIVATTVVGGASGTITLDRPLSQDVSLTGTTAEYITAAAAAAAEFGIRITGVAAPFDVNRFRDYYANRFTATFSDSSTLVTHVQGAFNGNGVWQQVAMDEYMSYGYEGQNEQLAVPALMRDQEVKIPGIGGATAATSKYSALNIAWTEDIRGLVNVAGAQGNVVVYLNLDASANLGTSGSTGEALVVALGLTAANFDE